MYNKYTKIFNLFYLLYAKLFSFFFFKEKLKPEENNYILSTHS